MPYETEPDGPLVAGGELVGYVFTKGLYLTTRSAAIMARVSERTVSKWIQHYGLPAVRVGGGLRGVWLIAHPAFAVWAHDHGISLSMGLGRLRKKN